MTRLLLALETQAFFPEVVQPSERPFLESWPHVVVNVGSHSRHPLAPVSLPSCWTVILTLDQTCDLTMKSAVGLDTFTDLSYMRWYNNGSFFQGA